MTYSAKARHSVDEYAQLGLRTDIETATPHRLILLLLDGALEKVRIAERAIEHGNIAAKGKTISWAISIIDGLRASLNLELGGAIAANLDQLYDYMTRTLVSANLHSDKSQLEEVERLLREIRSAWKGIESQVDRQSNTLNRLGGTTALVG